MIFKTPWLLVLIPVILIAGAYFRYYQRPPRFKFSSFQLVGFNLSTWKIKLIHLPQWIRTLVLVLFIVALAGPRLVTEETVYKTEGIDIVLAIDTSGSMQAEDFVINNQRSNRLAIVKNVVEEFINNRTNDNIGLVAFAGLAYTVCPLTTDYSWVTQNLERVEIGLIEDGTAVGSAIAASVARLRDSKAKSKIIILLTDGLNNAGNVDPAAAARAAQALGIKIYTIGAGSRGLVPFPGVDMFGRKGYRQVQIDLDEKSLKEIADITGGQYFRATDTEALRTVYKQIDQLEKTEVEKIGFFEYDELFDKVLMLALLLLILEVVLSKTVLMKTP